MSRYEEREVKSYVPPVRGHRPTRRTIVWMVVRAIALAIIVVGGCAGMGYGLMALTDHLTRSEEERTAEDMDRLWGMARHDGNVTGLCTAWALGRDAILRTTVDGIEDSQGYTPDREVIERSFDDQCYLVPESSL